MNSQQDLLTPLKIVYTAQSKHLYYAKMFVCQFTVAHHAVPLNPFNIWSYFLNDLVERDVVRRGNNNVIRISDEVWIFGPISNGVYSEILYGISLNKPLRLFSLGSSLDSILPLKVDEVEFESCVLEDQRESLKGKLRTYGLLISEDDKKLNAQPLPLS